MNEYVFDDVIPHLKELKIYIRTKVNTEWVEDIIHDTMLYLFLKWDQLIITNLKGFLFNTSNFFIKKWYFNQKRYCSVTLDDVNTTTYTFIQEYGNNAPEFTVSDKLYYNLRTVSTNLLVPFQMQMEDKSIKEIAKDMELSENVIKTRISRCKTYLKQGL